MSYLFLLTQHSLIAAAAIGVILILRKFLAGKVPMRIFIVLWLIVIFRLLVPHSISSPVSFQSLMPSMNAEYAGMILPDETMHAFIPEQLNILPAGLANSVSDIPAMMTALDIAAEILDVDDVHFALFGIWAGGAALVSFFIGVMYLLIYRVTRFADCAELVLEEQDGFAGMKIYLCRNVSSPVTIGFFKPAVYLPFDFNINRTSLLKYVLMHEKTHIVRKDNFLKLIALTALAVHWFNPFVWAMVYYLNRDIELSCDESVIRQIGFDSRQDYAESLLCLAAGPRKFQPEIFLFAVFGYHNLKERVLNIMKAKMSRVFSIALAIMLTLGTFAVFAANAPIMPAESVRAVTSLDSDSHNRSLPAAAKITPAQAEEIALKEVANSDFVKDFDLDYSRRYGCWVYEVEVLTKERKEYEVYINAETGKVLRVKKNWDWD